MSTPGLLSVILKKKGTGPTMSKTVSDDELEKLPHLLQDPTENLTTKATLITAFLMLENLPSEAKFLEDLIKNHTSIVPKDLHFLLSKTPNSEFESMILKVIGHTDLTYDEMTIGMTHVLSQDTPDYLKACFLEAERLKRETIDENISALDICQAHSTHWIAKVPRIIDLSVAYDGFNRTPCVWIAVAPVLASLGWPCVLHGVDEVSPKRGVNAFKVLQAGGHDPIQAIEKTISAIENPTIGWGYVDQRISSPTLYKLKKLRQDMIKRPILATIEKLLKPIRGTQETLTVTSYTHPPYRDKMITLCRHHSPDRFAIVRGVEGSIQLPTDRRAPLIVYNGKEVSEDFSRPDGYETEKYIDDPNLPLSGQLSYQWCVEGLSGTHPWATPWIKYLAGVILSQFSDKPSEEIQLDIKKSIDSGDALRHFHNQKQSV